MIRREGLEERIDAVVSPVMNDSTPGMALLVAEGDEILLRKAYGMADLENKVKVKPEDNFVIASNTKQFTCIAIMMLKEQGLLDYDETIERFFPDFPDYVKKVTIRQMMMHQSGIKEYFEEDRWKNYDIAEADTAAMLEVIKSFGDLDFEPCTQYSYSNSAYVMLGAIVEKLSGIPFGKFVEEKILKPVGMNNSYAPDYMDEKPAGLIEGYTKQEDGSFEKQVYDMILVGYADGNIQSNVDDLLKWHNFLFRSDSELLLKRETLNEAFHENLLADGSKSGYGFGFFIGDDQKHREIWHTGGTEGFISRVSRYVDDDLSVIMLTNYEGLPKNWLYEKILDQIFED